LTRRVLITGASGNLGTKAVAALGAAVGVEPLDLGDADLSAYDTAWAERFRNVDVVLHLAADPSPFAAWDSVTSLNLDLSHNVLRAAEAHGVGRFVFASSNWVLGGYRFTDEPLRPDTTPRPINAYGMSKLAIERAGAAVAAGGGMSFLALRIGWCPPGDNRPGPHMAFGRWGQQLWLSNDDWAQAVRLACTAPFEGSAIVNVMSENGGSRWDLSETERVIGYRPASRHTPRLSLRGRLADAAARLRDTIVPSPDGAPVFGARW
jgi:NAD+ dependent glucose-6-phosphate dehydrogenase